VSDDHFAPEIERLRELERDQLVRLRDETIDVAAIGRTLLRNIATVFDAYFSRQEQPRRQVFSKTL